MILLCHVLIQLLMLLIEEFPLVLLRIREIPGPLFSNSYPRFSPDRVYAFCGVFCAQNHPFDQNTDQGHILFHCEQKLLLHISWGTSWSRFPRFLLQNQTLFCRFYSIAVLLSKHREESKLIFVFDGSEDLPIVMGS